MPKIYVYVLQKVIYQIDLKNKTRIHSRRKPVILAHDEETRFKFFKRHILFCQCRHHTAYSLWHITGKKVW